MNIFNNKSNYNNYNNSNSNNIDSVSDQKLKFANTTNRNYLNRKKPNNINEFKGFGDNYNDDDAFVGKYKYNF